MKRGTFLKQLIASLAIGKLPVAVTKDFRKIYLLQCFVAGFRFYEGMNLLSDMKEGDLLELKREADNKFDKCAIALHWRNKKIGFIPAATNEMLSYLIDSDALSLFGVITHLEKNAQPWENVAVAVYFVQEADKDLPAHANHLTRIEAPHYRTLKNTNKGIEDNFEKLLSNTNRLIDLDKIPYYRKDAKDYFAAHYKKHIVNKEGGNYVLVNDDGIYTYLYDVSNEINTVSDEAGNLFYEFTIEG